MFNQLKIENSGFTYNVNSNPVFDNLNYNFNSGSIVGLYGANGCGKTTLLNCISGYYKPTSGEILLNNKPVEECKNQIAMINSDMDLFEYLTLLDNIKFFLAFHKKESSIPDINVFLENYDLTDHKEKYVFGASNGMLKKTQIIIALLLKPGLLLADEPVNELDEKAQATFFSDINKISRENGTIVIFSIHNEELLKKYCNHIIYL